VRRLRPVLLLLGIPFLCLAQTDSRIPAEVRYKSGYINPVPKLPDFTSVMLWGIVIADNRIPGYQHAQVEIDRTQLSCRVDGKDVVQTTMAPTFAEGSTAAIPGSAPTPTILSHSASQRTTAPSFCALARARIASGISGAPRPGLAFRRGI